MIDNSSEKILAKEEISDLRTEIVESEKARIDFLKYKLMAIASLASIGLGFGAYQHNDIKIPADYVLCVIPFVCAYVDLICYHNTLRILVIANFLKYYDDPYEGYITKLTDARYLFNMEDFVLHWSSVVVSCFVALYSLVPFATDKTKGMTFLLVGLGTIVLHFLTKASYKNHQTALFDAAAKELKNREGDSQC